jgi:7-carboxy-7-deazaguanine synthase
MLQITEIYRSLQGESSFAGLPCIFVRLTACNLRCSWCDSEYTFTGGKKMSQEDVLGAVRRLAPVKTVEITGGEPMLQERELVPLMRALLAEDYTVLLETSGERPLANVPKEVIKIVDVKCPGSSEAGSFREENLQALTERDELKFVLSDRADYEFAHGFIGAHRLEPMAGRIIFSPAFRKDARRERSTAQCLLDPQQLAEWILEDGLPVRLGLQIHKFIWQPELTGV